MPFEFVAGELSGLMIIHRKVFGDRRGNFSECFKKTDFVSAGIKLEPVQDNLAFSEKGVLRGLHYQVPPMAQGKLVTVVTGEIFDVAVDLRKGSPTFGRWQGVRLSQRDGVMFWIPPGFAHGYLVISETAHVGYKVFGAEYSPAHERGILWNDPHLAIKWPTFEPRISKKDAVGIPFAEIDPDFVFQGEQ